MGEGSDQVFIQEGQLHCNKGHCYDVTRGIPRMVIESEVSTAAHFAQEFTALAADDADLEDPEMSEFLFYSRTGLDPSVERWSKEDPYRTESPTGYSPDRSAIQDKVILDAGCGPGRFIAPAAQGARHVVGLDIGKHIDRAAQRLQHLPNVDFVQGSVLEPPFLPGSFDLVFSVGVLHHVPDPGKAVLQLANSLVPGGVLTIWVYPPEYWPVGLRGILGRRVHGIIARMPRAAAWWVCARVLYPIGLIQRFFSRKRWLKLIVAPLYLLNIPRHPRREVMISTIFDYYGPSIISTHEPHEAVQWLKEAGLEDIRVLPVATSVSGSLACR